MKVEVKVTMTFAGDIADEAADRASDAVLAKLLQTHKSSLVMVEDSKSAFAGFMRFEGCAPTAEVA